VQHFYRILVINDDEALSHYLREKLIISGGFDISFKNTACEGLEAFADNSFDIIVARYGMTDLSTWELVQGLRKSNPDSIIILFLPEPNPKIESEMLDLGVYDFITPPINLEKLLFLLKKGAELHGLLVAHRRFIQSVQEQNLALQKQNILLAKRIEESTKNLARLYGDLRSTYMRTIRVLAQAIDARDHYTHSHSENVAQYATAIAQELGLSADETEKIREACELHDLGKIGVGDNILGKESDLSPEEWEQIKRHPATAAQILEPLTFLDDVILLVKQHHEHYDGSGYPQGLKGNDIVLGARILHVADAYEAMRSARSYRKIPLSKEAAVAEIKKNSGLQFDPAVVEAFLKVVSRL